MDKIDTLFTQPLVAKKSSEEAVDFNKWLIYDEEKIYCGNTNFTYEDLFEVFYADSYEKCLLRNGVVLFMEQIFYGLMLNFSFKMSNKIDEY